MTKNLLVYAELNSNSLERALRLNAPEHSITIKIAKLGQKHNASLLSAKTRKKRKLHSNNCKQIIKTQYKSDYPLPKRFLRYHKTLNYFKAENKLYRHD